MENREEYSGREHLSEPEDSSSKEEPYVSDEEASSKEAERRKRSRKHDGRPLKKKPVSRFLDVEAAVGEDEEDEEELAEEDAGFVESDAMPVEDELREAQVEMDAITARRFLRQQQLKEQVFDPEKEARRIRETYGQRPMLSKAAALGVDAGVPLVVPGIADAKLWLVRCKPGKEQAAAHALLRVALEKRARLSPLSASKGSGDDVSARPVLSVLCRDQLRGFVYIEAHRPTDVVRAVHDAHIEHWLFTGGSTGSSLSLVPLDEMAEVLSAPSVYGTAPISADAPLPVIGAWARVKRGKYANDLAQVTDVAVAEGVVRVKLVPRLATSGTPAASKEATTAGRQRPPQRLFDPKQAAAIGALSKSRGFWILGGESYKDGFLFKHLRPAALITGSIVPPKPAELQFFGVTAADVSMSNAASAAARHPSGPLFAADERVRVIHGEMIGLVGVIREIVAGRKDEEPALYRVEFADEALGEPMLFPESALQRYFEIGEPVRSVADGQSGGNGIIVAIDAESDLATIFNPLTSQEWQVDPAQLRSVKQQMRTAGASSAATSEGLDSLLVDDLVRFVDAASPGVLAVVLRVNEAEQAVQVLDQSGQQRSVPQSHVRLVAHHASSPINAATRSAVDAGGFGTGDLVEAIDSPRQAMLVVHTYGESVFCRDPLTGHLSAHSAALLRRKHDARHRHNGPRLPLAGPSPRHVLGKTVSIAGGPYKGYIGIVKEITDTMARVELHTNSKLVAVDRDRLVLAGAAGAASSTARTLSWNAAKTAAWNAASSGKTPTWNMPTTKTPTWNMPTTKTPTWNMSTAKTPTWNMSTAKTPTWNMAAAKTPTWNAAPVGHPTHAQGSKTPTWNSGKTPVWDNRSSAPRPDIANEPSSLSRDPRRQQAADAAIGGTALPNWAHLGVEVTGLSDGRARRIMAVQGPSHVSLAAPDGSVDVVSIRDLKPAAPSKKDRVLIHGDAAFDSHVQRRIGSLIGLDGDDAVVKLDDTGDFRIVNIANLAKMSAA